MAQSPNPTRDLPSNDYHFLPATEKQLRYARDIAARRALELPSEVQQDRRTLSSWIEAHRSRTNTPTPSFSNYPSSKQVAFAERIAQFKRRKVPQECFRDRQLMSRWIDCNK